MATSMALGGPTGMTIGLSNSSPMGGVTLNGGGSIGNLTPSGMKYITTGGGSAASSVHSPISTPSSTPNSTITINNSTASGSMGKCPGSVTNNNNGNIGNSMSSSGSMSMGSNTSPSDIFGSKCKRKINFSNLGMPGRAHQPATVARRNARERNRVKQVNNGFAALKQHIPLGHRSKKMSKVETLRCAVDYIRNLQGLLGNIHGSLGSSSPTGSSFSGDIILMDDDENQEQLPSSQHQQAHQQQQMNGVNNQRDAFALSSSSSSSPTSSEFGASVAALPHHLALLQSHQHNLQHQHHLANNNSNNQLRHLSLSHHHIHGTNSVSVATALIVDSNSSNAVTPNSNQLSPTSSEDPSSPYTSEASSYMHSNVKGANMPYDYENYEPVSPEDEELLDAIAWWQQS